MFTLSWMALDSSVEKKNNNKIILFVFVTLEFVVGVLVADGFSAFPRLIVGERM